MNYLAILFNLFHTLEAPASSNAYDLNKFLPLICRLTEDTTLRAIRIWDKANRRR